MCRQWLLAGLLVGCGISAIWAEDPKTDTPAGPSIQEAAPANDNNPAKPQTPPAVDAEKAGTATAEELSQWTQDLVNPKFAVRQAASQKLVQAGKGGMDAAAEAAKTDDLELATRCLSVLTEGLNSKTEEVKQAARTALQNLAKSENKSVAQRAKLALEAPVGLDAVGGRNFRQIRVNIVNGAREMNIQENGKQTVIKDNNGKEITVTTTETVNGQKVTKSATGKDAEDLKKNNPDAHAVFEKYAKGGNGAQLQFGINGNGVIRFGQQIGVPARPNRLRIVNPIKAANAFDEIDKLREQLEESNEKLSKAAESDKPDTADLKAISAEIKTLTKRLGEIKTELQIP
jgi:hypothetical protein